MAYLDIMVAAVPTAKRDEYRTHARKGAALFRRHGALDIAENWGSDVPDGEVTSFPMAVKKTADETVVVSWIVWPSKQARDTAWAEIDNDPEMGAMFAAMPFDGNRLIYGGFESMLED